MTKRTHKRPEQQTSPGLSAAGPQSVSDHETQQRQDLAALIKQLQPGWITALKAIAGPLCLTCLVIGSWLIFTYHRMSLEPVIVLGQLRELTDLKSGDKTMTAIVHLQQDIESIINPNAIIDPKNPGPTGVAAQHREPIMMLKFEKFYQNVVRWAKPRPEGFDEEETRAFLRIFLVERYQFEVSDNYPKPGFLIAETDTPKGFQKWSYEFNAETASIAAKKVWLRTQPELELRNGWDSIQPEARISLAKRQLARQKSIFSAMTLVREQTDGTLPTEVSSKSWTKAERSLLDAEIALQKRFSRGSSTKEDLSVEDLSIIVTKLNEAQVDSRLKGFADTRLGVAYSLAKKWSEAGTSSH